ncbi:hypothetical protein PBI_KSSJEB_38 [Mycobacterium phage KSSJEB]|uniref:Uncharacterized protein n=2 Tax=Fromanvirus TaxID=186764 RepID=G1D6Y2_9CAUD|nr:hypothetical protein FGG25_gp38 [Mycobacterium phage KSSJEB]AEK10531.1 hypothetical protein PBI_KSSJEB_38 [Mycobacterium phage KSSJEB]
MTDPQEPAHPGVDRVPVGRIVLRRHHVTPGLRVGSRRLHQANEETMSKKKKDVTVEQLAVITDRLTEAVDLLKIISTQTRQSEVITVRQHDDPELQRRKVSAAQEIEAIRAEEAERYHAYRDKPLQPYVRVHEAP